MWRLGNVIGSNMFNLLGIIGVASLVGPITVDPEFLRFDLWVMLGASLLLIPLCISGAISRGSGAWPDGALCGLYGGCSDLRTSSMKRALVTGAGQRLGRAMALYLADRGFDVAVHYASFARAPMRLCRDQGHGAQRCRAAGRPAGRGRDAGAVARAVEALGGPMTCLVNNASIFEYDNIHRDTRQLGPAYGSQPARALCADAGMAAQGLHLIRTRRANRSPRV